MAEMTELERMQRDFASTPDKEAFLLTLDEAARAVLMASLMDVYAGCGPDALPTVGNPDPEDEDLDDEDDPDDPEPEPAVDLSDRIGRELDELSDDEFEHDFAAGKSKWIINRGVQMIDFLTPEVVPMPPKKAGL